MKSYFCKKSALKKILILRFSSIGDIVLTTPVVRCLKQQLPGARVHYAVKEAFLPVIRANPHIDQFHVFRGELREFIRELRKEKFDFIVDLHNNQRTLLIKTLLQVPSASFPKLNLRKWLLVRFKWNLLPDVHIVDRYFRAVRKLKVKNDGKGLDYFIPAGEEIGTESLWTGTPSRHPGDGTESLQTGMESLLPGYTAIVVGAKHRTKAIPEHRIIALCRQSQRPVVLLGGPEDRETGERIAAGFDHEKVVNACGSYSINGSASLIRQAGLVITPDTGLMHIAAAFRKKIISVWGNTVPEFGMYPYLPEGEESPAILEVKGLPCRPCSKLGYEQCPKGHFKCMEEVGF